MTKNNLISLDVDGVIANFVQLLIDVGYIRGLGSFFPKSYEQWDTWDFSEEASKLFEELKYDDKFWLNIKPFDNAAEITHKIKPISYVTMRPIRSEITEKWLENNNFYKAKVYTVSTSLEKLEALEETNSNIFVDDKPENCIVVAKSSNILAYLLERPWNKNDRYAPRIKKLEEVIPVE